MKTYYVLCRASCGVSLPLLSNICFQKSLKGLEFACSIPATIGGAVKMNAGAFGGEIKDIAFRFLILNLKTKQIYSKYNANCQEKCFQNIKTLKFKANLVKNTSKTCFKAKKIEQMLKSKTNIIVLHRKANFLQFDYRFSSLEDEELVLYVDFLLKSGNKQEIEATIQQNKLKRQLTQNVGYPNLGSVFKRSQIVPAKVIDEMGLKGLQVGGAMISKVHSGFVVNYCNATSDDVLKLLKKVQNLICKKYNFMLQYEIKFLGDCNGKRQHSKH